MYYILGQACVTNWGSFVLLQIRANVATNWGNFIITNWGKCLHRVAAVILEINSSISEYNFKYILSYSSM